MRFRALGLPLAAAALLIAGAVKLWQAGGGPAAGGAMFGCGLMLLGVAVRDWLEHHDHTRGGDDRGE